VKVACEGAIRSMVESWGWQVADEAADATLTPNGDFLEIRLTASGHPDDIAFFPVKEAELKARIARAQDRRTRLAKRLHDLRSPLNAIQGYAEMIAETADGDALRFASNIRTASETLTSRLENFRDEGV